jgi:KDO2-lipid IV(A) lauroyltransferase
MIDFFGSPARLPDGPVRVALRTGVPIVPAFASRLPDDTFAIHIEPPLDLPETGDHETDVRLAMQEVVKVLERHIARQPEQWLVVSPVWPVDGSQAPQCADENYDKILRLQSRKGQ